MEGVGTYDALFKAVEEGQAQYGIVPIENSYSGSLHNVYDLLLAHPLHIVGTHPLAVTRSTDRPSACQRQIPPLTALPKPQTPTKAYLLS